VADPRSEFAIRVRYCAPDGTRRGSGKLAGSRLKLQARRHKLAGRRRKLPSSRRKLAGRGVKLRASCRNLPPPRLKLAARRWNFQSARRKLAAVPSSFMRDAGSFRRAGASLPPHRSHS
jgi:hypothetical protein